MAFKILSALISDVERELYQLAGPQVQIYSQDIIAQMIQQAFNHVFLKRYWGYFRKREERTLDGVTGQITAPLTYISDYHDIQHVYREGSQRPLPVLPSTYNTLGMTGSAPRFITPSGDANLFTVYPLDAEGDVLVIGRRRPTADYAMDEEVEFDPTFLVHYVAWSYFTDDGSNPASALKHQVLFEKRLEELERADAQHAVVLDPHQGEIPQDWYYA